SGLRAEEVGWAGGPACPGAEAAGVGDAGAAVAGGGGSWVAIEPLDHVLDGLAFSIGLDLAKDLLESWHVRAPRRRNEPQPEEHHEHAPWRIAPSRVSHRLFPRPPHAPQRFKSAGARVHIIVSLSHFVPMYPTTLSDRGPTGVSSTLNLDWRSGSYIQPPSQAPLPIGLTSPMIWMPHTCLACAGSFNHRSRPHY